jgi:hypothetical protein
MEAGNKEGKWGMREKVSCERTEGRGLWGRGKIFGSTEGRMEAGRQKKRKNEGKMSIERENILTTRGG